MRERAEKTRSARSVICSLSRRASEKEKAQATGGNPRGREYIKVTLIDPR